MLKTREEEESLRRDWRSPKEVSETGKARKKVPRETLFFW